MKRIFFTLFAGLTLLLTGCFETTQEITLNEDGSGTYVNTNDMSKIISIVKNMGMGGNDKIPAALDTSFSLASLADSIANLSMEDKELLKTGNMHMMINMEGEKLVTTMSFPFTTPADIQKFNRLAGKVASESMKSKMPEGIPGGDEMPEASSFDDYYTLEFSKGELTKKLNKEKYASAQSDEFLKGLKEAGGMGIPITSTYIINLPRPATKAEGKNVKLSDDKKKVTIAASIDDFFDNPSSMEFKIKY